MPVSEKQILKLAVEKGYLRPGDWEGVPAGEGEAADSGQPAAWRILDALIQKGLLTWPQLAELIRQAEEIPPDDSSGPRDAAAPAGRYRVERFLGAGGMAEVYLAFDTQLRRHVAFKRLKADAYDLRGRFWREAQAQARVDHENICRIFDVGEQDGCPFIAMSYISGQTLDQAAAKTSLAQKVKIIQKVAEGLHAAHRLNLVHRDVKPTNIMVETGEDGRLKPYIMDFGLVRDLNRESLSVSSDIIGSPHYMSPEQIQGDSPHIDRRTDIYSLGVSCYQLFTGQLPFSGTTLAGIMMDILQKEARPVRQLNPEIPVDLETIVMKCMEKEPQRRYGSARELAEDLARFLDEEPILARRSGPLPRLFKKIKKHKAFSAFAVSAAILLAIMAGLWLQTRWKSHLQSQIAAEFGREVEKIETLMRYAHLLKPHNIRQDRQAVKVRMASIEKRMAGMGKSASGHGHYALGQGYLALRDFSRARQHLQLAWEAGVRTPEASSALGISLGEIYHAESARADWIPNQDLREKTKEKVKSLYIKPALRVLNDVRASQGTQLAYAEALIAFYENRFSDALRIIQKATERDARFYEMKILEGDVIKSLAEERLFKGDYASGISRFEEAVRAYREAVETGRSDANAYVRLGQLYERMANVQILSKGKNVRQLLDWALSYCDQAIQIDEEAAEAHSTRSAVYNNLGKFLSAQGKDPSSFFNESLESAKRAIAIQPEEAYFYYMAGRVSMRKGEYDIRHGTDPITTMNTAVTYMRKAIALNPNDGVAQSEMAWTLLNIAFYQMLRGIDAHENINGAVHSSRQLVRLFPDLAQAHAVSGNAYHFLSVYESERGGEARKAIDLSIGSFKRAITLTPYVAAYYSNIGIALLCKSQYQAAVGENPEKTYAEALHMLQKALPINPNLSDIHSVMGFIECERAYYQLLHGLDPSPALEQAASYLDKAHSLNPNNVEISYYLIKIEGIRARQALWSKRNPETFALAAGKRFREGTKINPDYNDFFNEYAAVLQIEADYRLTRGLSPAGTIAEAKRLLEKAISIRRDSFTSHRLMGELALLQARQAVAQKADPEPFFSAAARWVDVALKLNPRSADTFLTRAELWRRQAEWQMNRKEPALPAIEKGLKAAEDAAKINPDCAAAYLTKGLLLGFQARLTPDRMLKKKYLQLSTENLQKARTINLNQKMD